MSSENRDVILRIPSYTGPTVQLWDVPETAVATYSYTGSGGVTWGGAATSVAFFVSSYQYAAGALALSPDDSDLSLGTHFTKITSEGFNERPLTIELPPLSVGSKNEYWFTLPGFPGLVDWPANLVFPFEFYIARTVTSGGAGTVFFSVARVQTDGTLIDECPEVSLGSIDISGAGTTKTGSTAAYSFASGSATDRLRIKIRLNITSIMSSPSVRFRLLNKAVPQFGGWISTAALFGSSILFGGSSTFSTGHAYAGSGGITFGGSAAFANGHAYAASGGIVFGGTATLSKASTYAGTGGIVFGGAASFTDGHAWLASGGIDFGGAATTSYIPNAGPQTYTYIGSGGIVFGGVATVSVVQFVEADSRRWPIRWDAVATIADPLTSQSTTGRVRAVSHAVATYRSLTASSQLSARSVSPTETSVAGLEPFVAGSTLAFRSADARSVAEMPTLSAAGEMAAMVASAGSTPSRDPRSAQARMSTRSVSVGPDQVRQRIERDDEELLFLLEVA